MWGYWVLKPGVQGQVLMTQTQVHKLFLLESEQELEHQTSLLLDLNPKLKPWAKQSWKRGAASGSKQVELLYLNWQVGSISTININFLLVIELHTYMDHDLNFL